MSEEKKTLSTVGVGDTLYIGSSYTPVDEWEAVSIVEATKTTVTVVTASGARRKFIRNSGIEYGRSNSYTSTRIEVVTEEARERARKLRALEARRKEVDQRMYSLRFMRIPDEALDAVEAACEAFKATVVAAGCKL